MHVGGVHVGAVHVGAVHAGAVHVGAVHAGAVHVGSKGGLVQQVSLRVMWKGRHLLQVQQMSEQLSAGAQSWARGCALFATAKQTNTHTRKTSTHLLFRAVGQDQSHLRV